MGNQQLYTSYGALQQHKSVMLSCHKGQAKKTGTAHADPVSNIPSTDVMTSVKGIVGDIVEPAVGVLDLTLAIRR